MSKRIVQYLREVKYAILPHKGFPNFYGVLEGCDKIQYKPKFKKRISNQVPPNFLKARKRRVSSPEHQGGKGVGSQSEKPYYA